MGKKAKTESRRPDRASQEVRADYEWMVTSNPRVWDEPTVPPAEGKYVKACVICSYCLGGSFTISQEGFKSDIRLQEHADSAWSSGSGCGVWCLQDLFEWHAATP